MKNGMVLNWMRSPSVYVSPETRLSDARKIVHEQHIRALPVVQDDHLVGIITYRGLLRRDFSFLGDEVHRMKIDIGEERVSELMTSNPITITPKSLIPKAARIMLENKITALPVLSSEKLVGTLTNSDLFRFIIDESSNLKREMQVGHYMTDEVVTIDRHTSLLEAHRLMGMKRFRSLPVFEEESLIGIITRTDLMSSDPSRMVSRNNQELSIKILSHQVEEVMTSPVITIYPENSITDAARLMLDNNIHSLVVLDHNQKLAGIITESDLFLMVMRKF